MLKTSNRKLTKLQLKTKPNRMEKNQTKILNPNINVKF